MDFICWVRNYFHPLFRFFNWEKKKKRRWRETAGKKHKRRESDRSDREPDENREEKGAAANVADRVLTSERAFSGVLSGSF